VPPTHTLVQITDPHLVPEGALLRGRVDAGAGFARTLAVVEESGIRPDALVFTGDLVDAGDEASYRRFRAMVDPVAERLGAEVVVVAGNHDRRAALREHVLDGLPGGDEPLDRVHRLGGLRIVVLDTTVPGQPHGELAPAQLERLAAELADPAPDGTVLALHHPPLPNALPLTAAIALRDADRAALGAVLAGSDVRLVLAGHTHVVSAGAIAGVPVWTGGATSYGSDALAPGRGERVLLAPSASRIDLFPDALIVTSVPVDMTVAAAFTEEQVEAMLQRAG
jgi:3',5'-cyclic AMP phosphodiesterase CpdA